MKIKTSLTVFLIFPLLFQADLVASESQQVPTEAMRIERLVGLCRLWGAIKYFHPCLAYRDLDWDAALMATIPRVNAANDSEEYAAAVHSILSVLNDPATHVIDQRPSRLASANSGQPSYKLNGDGLLLVHLDNHTRFIEAPSTWKQLNSLVKEIPKARAILFDFRSDIPVAEAEKGYVAMAFNALDISRILSSEPISEPGQRARMHLGFVPQQGSVLDGYSSAFYIVNGQRIEPKPGTEGAPVVFLINANSELPPVALALQMAAKGAIVAEGSSSDASVVKTHRIQLGDGVTVQMRLGELVYDDGSGGLQPDIVVPVSSITGEQNPSFQAALSLAKNFTPTHAARRPLPSRVVPPPDKPYSEMSYPPVEYRLLGAFRIWTVIHYFFPYKDLMGEDWDSVLREFIPKMEKAKDAQEYHLTVAEMMTHIHDSHGRLISRVYQGYMGEAPPPVYTRIVEGEPVITGFRNEAAAKAAGVEIGDVVLRVDGEEIKDRIARLSKYIPASTPQGLRMRMEPYLLAGPENSAAALIVRNRAHHLKEVKLPRKAEYLQASSERTGEIVKVLPGSLGYADLERLEQRMVDEMFERLKDTKAIIFDLRGYPQGAVLEIAPRLTDGSSVPAALGERPILMSPDGPEGETETRSSIWSFISLIPKTDKWRYKGKTVALIDERAISHAENSGLFLRAANGTKFIGSPTVGADGGVTTFWVPGGILVRFTGGAVKHVDGRQLQRIGLLPDIEVRPTTKGIQDGRDEVLERAIEYLQAELN